MVNTPHNPTGKVFSRQELEAIADVVRENPRVRGKEKERENSKGIKSIVNTAAAKPGGCWGFLPQMVVEGCPRSRIALFCLLFRRFIVLCVRLRGDACEGTRSRLDDIHGIRRRASQS